MATLTKAQLAARLGRNADSLLSRREVAERMGRAYSYVTKLRDNGPGYYRTNEGGTGGEAFYPVELVDRFIEARRTKTRFEGKEGVDIGQLALPATPPQSVATPLQILSRIERWKKRNLISRFEDFNSLKASDPEAYERKYLALARWASNAGSRTKKPAEILADPQTDKFLRTTLDRIGLPSESEFARAELLKALQDVLHEHHVRWNIYKDFSNVTKLLGSG